MRSNSYKFFKAIWNKVDISSDDLARNKYIIGSYYIKFVLANKFLCITKSGDLFASVSYFKKSFPILI